MIIVRPEICHGQMDLVFILDSSGSIDNADYIRELQFVHDAVDALDISPIEVQVAAVVYGSRTNVAFYLNTYDNKADVLAAIPNIPKDDGGTDTAGAITLATEKVFTARYGARPNAKKVAMLLTDGASNDFQATVQAAKVAKNHGVIIFALGVGDVDYDELEYVASEPNCTHVFTVDSFTDIGSLLYEVRKGFCKAPTVFANTTTLTYKIDEYALIKIPVPCGPDDPEQILIGTVECGVVDIYASYSSPNVGPAFFDTKKTATQDNSAVLVVAKDPQCRSLYVRAIGTRIQDPTGNRPECVDPKFTLTLTTNSRLEVVCKENGIERPCTKDDIMGSHLGSEFTCNNNNLLNVSNPCTPSAIKDKLLIHPHPHDPSMYIQCSMSGKMYLTHCPDRELFNAQTKSCGSQSLTGPTGGKPLDPQYGNPCTVDMLLAGQLFFPYSPNKHQYIHCDVWGKPWVQDCPNGLIWNDPSHTCVSDFLHEFDKTTASSVVHNPCTHDALERGDMFHPYPGDPNKFIHCDVSGNYWIQSCQPHLYYDPVSHVCVTHPQG